MHPGTPEVSVVVCTYNRADSLARALDSLFLLQLDDGARHEIVVVDDHSTDHTARVVAQCRERAPVEVVYVPSPPGSKGVASARSLGVGAARGEWIAFFDDDQCADRDWLAGLLRVASRHGAYCVGGAIVVKVEEPPPPLMGPVCRSLLGEHIYPPTATAFTGHELPSSGNLLVHRSVFDAVGLFDDRAHSGEDTEFLTRARAGGYAIWSAPAARVYHMVPRYRTERAYLQWVSYRWGMHYVEIDYGHSGLAGLLLRACARMVQAVVVHFPRWLLARLHGDRVAALDRRCLLWRAEAYLRCTLHHLMPGRHEENAFMRTLEFRAERELFGPAAASANNVQPR